MSKETEVMDSAITKLQGDQGTSKDVTITLTQQIVDLFAAHAQATPERVIQGSKKWSQAFIGRVHGAWFVHKSGIAVSLINPTFIANNLDDIKIQSSAKAMEDELGRVSKLARQNKKDQTAAEVATGKAFNDNLVEASNAVVLVKNTHTVYSEQAETNLALLEAQVASLRAQFNTAKRIKEESLVG